MPAPGSGSSIPLIDVPVSAVPFTSKNFLGLGLSFSNAGVTRGMFKATQDEILMGQVGESSWGMGLIADWSEEGRSSFRMKWGVSRVRVELTDALRAEHGPDSLEEALNLVTLDFVLRDVLPVDDSGMDLWWGGGFTVHHVWSSSTPGRGQQRVSKLRHSTMASPLVSLGTDLGSRQGHQILLQGDWILTNGFQLTVGLRTQL